MGVGAPPCCSRIACSPPPTQVYCTMATAVKATVQGSANIAVIKYWGKRDVPLNLPINSSLSATLDNADLCTTTTATVAIRHAESERDSLQLNGEEQDVQGNGRLLACLAHYGQQLVSNI